MEQLLSNLLNKKEKLAVVGLGYVGLPLLVAFSKKLSVVGFDINTSKIEKYKKGIDVTNEVGNLALKEANIRFTSTEDDLKNIKVFIIAVPTPINRDKTPNLEPLISSSKIVSRYLKKDSIVVYESTVYPGVTEDICIKILEKGSSLRCGKDFKVGYSPERINPGDSIHKLENIVKVVSAIDEKSCNDISDIYSLVSKAGVYKAKSIKVAEAAKVIENSQRDINIAFMNELSIIFNKLDIDTKAVLEAASTKWNFLNFTPGLVGGHCIGVDPYYLTYKAEELGYHPQVILSGRRINDGMGKYVAENTVKLLIKANRQIKNSKVLILGITFKENINDVRNSRVIDIIDELTEYGLNVLVNDPMANPKEVYSEYRINLIELNEYDKFDAIIVSVPHKHYESINLKDLANYYTPGTKVLVDVKGLYDKSEALKLDFSYWSL